MISPLLEAIRDRLRVTLAPLNIDTDSIQVTPNEKVNADSGQVAVSIYSIDVSPSTESGNAILAREYSVAVGVTTKSRFVPVDRRGETLYTDIQDSNVISVDEVLERVIKSIHGRPDIVQKATQYGAKLAIVYSEPLYLSRSISNPEEKSFDHWNISETQFKEFEYNEQDYEGLYQEVVFQGAKCFQPALDFKSVRA